MNAVKSSNFSARQLAVGLAGYCTFINLYSPQAILPLLSTEFGAGAAEISTIMTASTLAVALTAPFTGTVADVLGRKRVIVTAMLLLGIPTVMCALAPTLHALIFWRFMQGLVMPPIFAVTIAYIGDEWPAHEATAAAGVYTSGASLGGFSGRFITGILSDQIGWRGALVTIAVMTFVGGLAVMALLPREKKFVRSAGLIASAKQMLQHFRNPQLVATYAVGFGVLFSFVALFTYINFRLAAPPYNLTPTWLGAIFITYMVGSALTPLAGWAVGRFGRRRFMIPVMMLWILGVALTLSGPLWLIVRWPHHQRRQRSGLPGDLDRLCHHHRQGRPLVGGRTLCDLLLYRRQFRRSAGRRRLDLRRLAGLRRDDLRDATDHGRRHLFRLDAAGAAGASDDANRTALTAFKQRMILSENRYPLFGIMRTSPTGATSAHSPWPARRQSTAASAHQLRSKVDAAWPRHSLTATSAADERRERRKPRYRMRSSHHPAIASSLRRCSRFDFPSSRSACSTTSISGALCEPGNFAAKASASCRRHSKHGRCPAANAVTSSRKNNSV